MSKGAACPIFLPPIVSLIPVPHTGHLGKVLGPHCACSSPSWVLPASCPHPAPPHLLMLTQQVMPLQEVLVLKLLLHQLMSLLQLVLLHLPQGCLSVCGGHTTHPYGEKCTRQETEQVIRLCPSPRSPLGLRTGTAGLRGMGTWATSVDHIGRAEPSHRH